MVRIVTDSTCDLSPERQKALGVEVVPLSVHFGAESFLDGIDLSNEEFYARLRTAETLPTTAQVNPEEFISRFQAHVGAGDQVVGIFLASQMSSYDKCTDRQYLEYGKPYDLRVLEAAGKGWMNTIHCHGDHIMFHILKDYPVQVFNWHAWESLPALDEAYALTGKCLMGGLSRTDITQQNRGAIQNQIFQCFKLLGGRHQILTPGCVIRYPLDDDMLSFIGTTRNEIEAVFDQR